VAEPAGGFLGGLPDDPGLLADRFDGLLDLVLDEHVGGLLDRVDDVVQLGGERIDVLTVEGGDEGGVEPGQDGVGDAVAFVLVLGQPFGFSSWSTKSSRRTSSSREDSAMLSAAASNRSTKDSSRGKIRSLMLSASQRRVTGSTPGGRSSQAFGQTTCHRRVPPHLSEVAVGDAVDSCRER
jgi:hypothetical protein